MPGAYAKVPQLIGCDAAVFRRAALCCDLVLHKLALALGKNGDAKIDLVHRNWQELLQLHETVKMECQQIRLYDDVQPVFARLRASNIPFGLVSNAAKPYAKAVSDLLSASDCQPDFCIWSCEVGYRKPQQEIYQQAFNHLKIPTSHILMVGDNIKNDFTVPIMNDCEALLIMRKENSYDRSINLVPEGRRIVNLGEIFASLKVLPQLAQKKEIRIMPLP